jgi:hypothetical protein
VERVEVLLKVVKQVELLNLGVHRPRNPDSP